MRRVASLLLIGAMLSLGGGLAPASAAESHEPEPAPAVEPGPEPAEQEPVTPAEQEPVIVRPHAVPLPSAGLGGLALLSLIMLRRWFRQRI